MNVSLITVFGAVLTISVRLTGLMLFAPFFGSTSIPARLKAMVVLALTVMLYPSLASRMPSLQIAQWPMVVISELMIGMAMGVATNIVFDAVQMAGSVLSVQMGFSLINILDPQTQVDSTVVALFHQTIAMLIFLRLDVPYWILHALVRSFEYLPPSSGVLTAAFVAAVLHVGASVFVLGVQIAAPVLSATMVADVALGILGRASPQLPLLLIGPAVKSVLGLSILFAALKYWPRMFERMFLNSVELGERLLHLAR